MLGKQHTIRQSVSVSGIGLHTGKAATMTFHAAPANHGFVFKRVDVEGAPLVHANVDNVVDTSRGTTIAENGTRVHTVEHTLAALVGLQIDNVLIELDGPEPPIMDGSSKFFLAALMEAERVEQHAARKFFVIDSPIEYQDEERKVKLTIRPAKHFAAKVKIDFQSSVLPPQEAHLTHIEQFTTDFGHCRTFCFVHEIEMMHKAGLIQGGSLENAIVIADKEVSEEEMARICTIFNRPNIEIHKGVLNTIDMYYENEPARHKVLDLVGDLALLGVTLIGEVRAERPGHKANVELAKRIQTQIKQKRITSKFQQVEKQGVVFDIHAIMKILPHRYPFLLVDKITEFNENTIEGIKNVTINEPFFVGHFEGNPIMPGVLQLEAMAQVGGILMLNKVEDPSSVWVYFVAIDNARFKKPVIPGDQIVFKMELLLYRRGICKMKGEAYVDGNLVCSADLTASIVPKNQ